MNRCPTFSYTLFVWSELVFLTMLRGGEVVVDLPPVKLRGARPALDGDEFFGDLDCP